MYPIFIYFFTLLFLATCGAEKTNIVSKVSLDSKRQTNVVIVPGAERLALYHPMIKNKRVGLVVNQTSVFKNTHLVDTLLEIGVNVVKILAPEHGFRGEADAGEKIKDDVDPKTGIPVISLYGSKKKPSPAEMVDIDILIFDIQDVGVRFYTYISTLHYVMESCAQNNIPLIVLDRPNPNIHYVDGPVLDSQFSSFVGIHSVPVVYGLTIGEYATMINGEKWLKDGVQCDLQIVENKNYTRDSYYDLPVRPSPNLPNALSILLYPSLCFFEGTTLSIGRGTQKQFQVIGHPSLTSDYFFVPKPNFGSKSPPLNGEKCFGEDLTINTIQHLMEQKKLDLRYLLSYYEKMKAVGQNFFLENLFFDKLAGTDALRKMIISGKNESEIRASWKNDLEKYEKIRRKYLLYE
ncbi:MAG: DUF1343 domain-containing protein [Saprospiraceae bacterium]